MKRKIYNLFTHSVIMITDSAAVLPLKWFRDQHSTVSLYSFPKNYFGLSKISPHVFFLCFFIVSVSLDPFDVRVWILFLNRRLQFRWPLISNDCVLECASLQQNSFHFPFDLTQMKKKPFFSLLYTKIVNGCFFTVVSVVSFRWSLHHEMILCRKFKKFSQKWNRKWKNKLKLIQKNKGKKVNPSNWYVPKPIHNLPYKTTWTKIENEKRMPYADGARKYKSLNIQKQQDQTPKTLCSVDYYFVVKCPNLFCCYVSHLILFMHQIGRMMIITVFSLIDWASLLIS